MFTWNETEHQFLRVSVRPVFLWPRLYILIAYFHFLFRHLKCAWGVSVKSGKFPCMWTLFSQGNTQLNNISCVRGPSTTSGRASVQIYWTSSVFIVWLWRRLTDRSGSRHHKYYRITEIFVTFIVCFAHNNQNVSYTLCRWKLSSLNWNVV